MLSGGKSTRMGTDKGLIEYHGKPQREYLWELLEPLCNQTFISVHDEEQAEFSRELPYLADQVDIGGPFNGMFSAHRQFPDAAWLVVACDMPMLDSAGLKHLIRERDPERLATAFATTESKLPEPLCAIWEPAAFDEALRFIQQSQKTCPRKFLINSPIKLVFPESDTLLMNANSREEYQQALAMIHP